jgi:predicted metal-dependent HD superfamily phosphohydrolase
MGSSLIQSILAAYRQPLGPQYTGYLNHCIRTYNYTIQLTETTDADRKLLAIAIAFHDIGIWTAHTFDYLPPSVALAHQYLDAHNLTEHRNVVEQIIINHHKLTGYKNNKLAEAFRKADLIDLTFGMVTFGIGRSEIKQLYQQYPSAGFHRFIAGQIVRNIIKHPLNPLPIVKW